MTQYIIHDILIYLPFALFLLVPWLGQYLILRFTRGRLRVLRWAILLPVAILVVLAVLVFIEGNWFWEVGVLFCLGLAALILAGWGLGWLFFSRWNPTQKQKHGENSD